MPTIISIADFFVSAHGGPHKEASGLPYASPSGSHMQADGAAPGGRHEEPLFKRSNPMLSFTTIHFE